MTDKCTFNVGQLVEYRTWYEGKGSWISIDNLVGVVLEIIQISEIPKNVFKARCGVIYDVKVYWIESEKIETVPDILLNEYRSEVII